MNVGQESNKSQVSSQQKNHKEHTNSFLPDANITHLRFMICNTEM